MALMETLVDDFTSGTINGTKWPTVSSGITVVSGRLQIVDSTGAYPSANSASSYDIRNSYALAQVTPAPRSGGNSQQTYFMFYASSGNGFGLAVGTTNLYKVTMVGGVETDTVIATYNATTHAWWRIRHNGTNIVLGWSSDGLSWTEGTPFAPGVTLGTTGSLLLQCGRYTSGDTATGFFDNVNNPPPSSTPKSDADTASGADNAGTVVQKYTGTETGTGTDNAGSVVGAYSGTDTGSGTDNAGTVVQKYTGSDTATGTDNAGTALPTFLDGDTGTGTDNAGTVVQKYTGTETGTGTDNAGSLAATAAGTETGSGTDNAGTVVQKYTGTDTGTGTDNAGSVVITQTLSSADTVSATDSAGSVAQTYTMSGADTGTGTDATSGRKAPDADTGAAVDNAGTLASALTGTDTATGTDTSVKTGLGGSETATGTDNAGSLAATASSSETGTAADAVTGKTSGSADTATGTDSSGNVTAPKSDADTATAVDAEPSRKIAPAGDTFVAQEGVSGKKHGDTDARTVVEAETLTNLASVPKSGSETVTRVEGQTLYTPGSFTQIPSPKTWSNGDSLDHGTLNKEWRDAFNWLLRRNSPGFSGYNADGAALTLTANVAIPIKTEEFKRGNLTHATNDTKVYVWETGWYLIYAQVGANYTSVSADGLKPASVIKVNGLVASRSQTTRDTNNAAMMEHQASLYLTAGDYVELAIGNDWTGTLTAYTTAYGYPFLSLWWRTN